MTERQRVDETKQIQQEIVLAIAQARDFQAAMQVTLQRVCQLTSWEYGEAWIPNQEDKFLELSPIWYSTPNIEALEKFRLCSEAFVLSANIGLPGRVWSSKQAEWIVDVGAASETYFLRNQIAKACGVKAGYGIPLIIGDRARVVLVFFMRQAQAEDEQLINLMAIVRAELERVLPSLGI